MSGPRIVPSEISGADLADMVTAAARARGETVSAFVRGSGLSYLGVAWVHQLRISRTPLARTIDRVNRAIAGEKLGLAPVGKPKPAKFLNVVKAEAEAIDETRIEALRAASEARAVLARVGPGGVRTERGREILIPGDVWAAVKAEASLSGSAPADVLITAIKCGLECLADDRAENERVRPGFDAGSVEQWGAPAC